MIVSGRPCRPVSSGGFLPDSGAQERFGVVQMGRPKLQCVILVAGDKSIQKNSVFIMKCRYVGVPRPKKCHEEADFSGNSLKESAQPGRVCGCHDCCMEAHVSLCGGLPILITFDLGKLRQGCPDRLRVRALADRADRVEFNEPAHPKDVCDILDGEKADSCTSPGFTFQEAVSDESLYSNARSGPRHTQLLGHVAVLNVGSR